MNVALTFLDGLGFARAVAQEHTMSADYAWEKTFMAVRSLAVGTGSIAERINDAWMPGLSMLGVHRMPWPDLQERWEALRHRIAQPGATAYRPLHSFGNEELGEIAREIWALAQAVGSRRDLR